MSYEIFLRLVCVRLKSNNNSGIIKIDTNNLLLKGGIVFTAILRHRCDGHGLRNKNSSPVEIRT